MTINLDGDVVRAAQNAQRSREFALRAVDDVALLYERTAVAHEHATMILGVLWPARAPEQATP
jgi:hypothetical protein